MSDFNDRDVLAILRGICALPTPALRSPNIEELLDVVRAIRLTNLTPVQVRFPTRDDRRVIAWLIDELEPHTLERGPLLGFLHRIQALIDRPRSTRAVVEEVAPV